MAVNKKDCTVPGFGHKTGCIQVSWFLEKKIHKTSKCSPGFMWNYVLQWTKQDAVKLVTCMCTHMKPHKSFFTPHTKKDFMGKRVGQVDRKSWTSNLSCHLLMVGSALTLHTWEGLGPECFSIYLVITQSTRHGALMGTENAFSHWHRGFTVRKNICSIPPVFHAEWECVSSSRVSSLYYNKTITP